MLVCHRNPPYFSPSDSLSGRSLIPICKPGGVEKATLLIPIEWDATPLQPSPPTLNNFLRSHGEVAGTYLYSWVERGTLLIPLRLKACPSQKPPGNFFFKSPTHLSNGNQEMITNLKSSWFLNKFSSSVPQEMYGEHYGENAYWCQGVMG